MIKLTFYKRIPKYRIISKEKYICMLNALSTNLHEISSEIDYQEAGEKMIGKLKEKLSEETFKGPFYLSRLNTPIEGIENPKEEELVSIKKSLDTFIQDNELKIKLELEN